MGFEKMKEEIEKLFPDAVSRELGEYAHLKYPKHLSMMKMDVYQYTLAGFGSIMVMNTSMMSLMKLSTVSFTPNQGKDVPFLLVDSMSMMNKRLAYVEFYNTTAKNYPTLVQLAGKYQKIKDYPEKDAWYVPERMKGSLIKCGTKKEEDMLMDMILDALSSYRQVIDKAEVDSENQKRLASFATRMVQEGNPSSATLEKVLGKEKAEDFFHKVVMPMKI